MKSWTEVDEEHPIYTSKVVVADARSEHASRSFLIF